MPDSKALYRHLPAVSSLIHDDAWTGVTAPMELRTTLCREAVAEVRAAIAAGALVEPAAIAAASLQAVIARVQTVRGPSLRPLVNGSGVLLHTNAGRAPLHREAQAALVAAAAGYNTLELDRSTGKRGSRQAHCRPLLRWLTGAEDAIVVNNGAAAVLLAMRAVARDRPVLVARSQLVEIGGGFRVPAVIAAAGCRLVEVGTTNRVHLRDYRTAFEACAQAGDPVAAVLQVHRSNFAIVGFAADPEPAQLAELTHAAGAQLVVDLGSGALAPLPIGPATLPDGTRPPPEPTVRELVAAGADVVTFSGDKLVGGPQAGLVVGHHRAVAAMATEPLARAVRVGGAVLAALEATLRLHAQGRAAELPALTQLHTSQAAVAARAAQWAEQLQLRLTAGWQVRVVAAPAQVGGGTHPLLILPSQALTFAHPSRTAADLAARAWRADPPVLGRVLDDCFALDVRSLSAGLAGAADPTAAESELLAALVRALGDKA